MTLHEDKTLFNQAIRVTAQRMDMLDIYIEKDYWVCYALKLLYDSGLKTAVDKEIFQNSKILENESYMAKMMMHLVVSQFKKEQNIAINTADVKRINSIIVKEYMNKYKGYIA